WLDRLDDAKVPYAIASSSHRENITVVLKTIGLQGRFLQMITSEDVHRGKPDPEVFLLAAGLLGLSARHCVVFEDALPGIEAGRRAGAAVVAVRTTHPPEILTAANRIVTRMDELSIADLAQLVGS
ncbi:MAG: HAD family phosphatase, partial [Kiritimatiellia bacterium]|nr:HAD family phosphatase [Kiritimatiellia bacterium]